MPGALNSVSNFVSGLADLTRAGGVLNTLAAPSFVISNIAVPGIPLISFRDYFLSTMESWITTIPLQTQFIVVFESFPRSLNSTVLRQLESVDGFKGYDIDLAKKAMLNYPLQSVVGCIFVDGINIGGESFDVDTAPLTNYGGLIAGHVAKDRAPYAGNKLTVQFRETNLSFTDLILRPWVVLAAHQGLVARPELESIKTSITVLQFTRTYQKLSQIPRKVWRFQNCVPVSVPSQDMSYDPANESAMKTTDVEFVYDRYTVEGNLYIPLPDIISKISRGSVPRISPLQ